MSYCQADLRSFLAQAADQVLHIRKPVDPATQVAALCSEATRPILFDPMAPRLSIVVDEDVDIYNMDDVLFALSIRADGSNNVEFFDGTRGLPEPLTTLILGRDDIRPLPNNRWAIDATKPSLAEPNRREEFVRLRARGEGLVSLKDFID